MLAGWACAAVFARPAAASVTHFASGISSANVPVSFKAELTIVGDDLTVVLTNTSPVASLNPNDVLGSYYFDIVDDANNRPALTYAGAFGDVYTGHKNNADSLYSATMNLMATASGDNTWQFRDFDAGLAPFLGFGIGTVGNSNVSPNSFQGNIVDGIDYSVYRGDVSSSNLHNKRLVRDSATFTFSGLTGFSEDDISESFAFGLGTAPDSFLVPEPAAGLLLGLGVCLLRRRRKAP